MNPKIKEIISLAESLEKNPVTSPQSIEPGQRPLAAFIDQTLLKPETTPVQIEQFCAEARQYGFASVCFNPIYLPLVCKLLSGSNVKPCTVIGFPLGAVPSRIKVKEAQQYLDEGARELDMVLPIGLLKGGNYEAVLDDIQGVVQAAKSKAVPVKVIFETVFLDQREKIIACLISQAAGASFVKTCTGFSGGGATVEDIRLMRSVVGPVEKMGVKAAGGIRTLADAQAMLKAGANRLGTSAGAKIIREFETGQKDSVSSHGY